MSNDKPLSLEQLLEILDYDATTTASFREFWARELFRRGVKTREEVADATFQHVSRYPATAIKPEEIAAAQGSMTLNARSEAFKKLSPELKLAVANEGIELKPRDPRWAQYDGMSPQERMDIANEKLRQEWEAKKTTQKA